MTSMSAPATTIAVLAIAIVCAAQLASVASPQPRQVSLVRKYTVSHMDPSIEHDREVDRNLNEENQRLEVPPNECAGEGHGWGRPRHALQNQGMLRPIRAVSARRGTERTILRGFPQGGSAGGGLRAGELARRRTSDALQELGDRIGRPTRLRWKVNPK